MTCAGVNGLMRDTHIRVEVKKKRKTQTLGRGKRKVEEEGDDERQREPGRRRQGEIGGERIRLSVIVSRCRTRGNSLTAEGRRQQGWGLGGWRGGRVGGFDRGRGGEIQR